MGSLVLMAFFPWKQWLGCGPTSELLILQWFQIHSSCSSEKMVLAPTVFTWEKSQWKYIEKNTMAKYTY